MQKMHYIIEITLCYINSNVTLCREHLAGKTKMSTLLQPRRGLTYDLLEKFKNAMNAPH